MVAKSGVGLSPAVSVISDIKYRNMNNFALHITVHHFIMQNKKYDSKGALFLDYSV